MLQNVHAFWTKYTITDNKINHNPDNNFKMTAFRTINTIQQLTEKQNYNNPSGIYKLTCNTCNGVYVGQSGRPINIRYKEHIKIYKDQ
jgi:hypothetical protein